ncbi:porphobilinogen synthase [Natranaerofaba carboxydovora]|uniref:porphobilinogen synthase n=1 Tax=Natranaerofaba carboxydovora TaxID=2742683 RepID=UPI001F12925D|nr:porphobilinogen synthase [Natranaerofaba carboxydovora]UMZ73207.1 Delta-aminolevulinic acid dehydratase [Natranaerofaba carboxydovora]
MRFPHLRLRRLRKNNGIRRMVKENDLKTEDLIYPLFVTVGENIKNPVPSMPGVYQYSVDELLKAIEEVYKYEIPAVILFGVPGYKDSVGTSGLDPNEAVQRACKVIKEKYPDLLVITDVCLCEYTDHGHCGVVKDGEVLNDETLSRLQSVAISHVRAGADIVAPSNMMDGYVQSIRKALDERGYNETPIMAYSAKYASSFYGPFRDAAESSPSFGDRRTYQMDPANGDEAIREVYLDIEEGADIVMVKPALNYMDVIRRVKDEFNYPVAAYNVSGEYSMIKAASQNGWIDEKSVVLEMLQGFKRAGADMILTYHALDAAKWLSR